MRQDMPKLNTIRSMEVCGQRMLSSRGNVRDLEELPSRQSMRSSVPHYTYSRVMNPAPAKRWLGQQVGRKWDAVYAELRARFDKRNQQQHRILNYLLGQVDRDVFADDGQLVVRGRWGTYPVGGFYVDPATGILCNAILPSRAKQRAEHRAKRAATRAAECVQVSKELQMRFLEGQWYWVRLSPVTLPKTVKLKAIVLPSGEELYPETTVVDRSSICCDVLTGQQFMGLNQTRYAAAELAQEYGGKDLYASHKWQASSRDVKRHVNA